MTALHSTLAIYQYLNSDKLYCVQVALHSTLAIYQCFSGDTGYGFVKTLHSTLAIYQSMQSQTQNVTKTSLHSTLAIYQSFFLCHFFFFRFSLHSTLAIYQSGGIADGLGQAAGLYIPLWLYINRTRQVELQTDWDFTFHFGYISILFVILLIQTPFNFTFHFGYISIFSKDLNAANVNSLHSTLAIYQSKAFDIAFRTLDLYIPLWLYINKCINDVSNVRKILYIPLWLYINLALDL